MGLKTMKSDGLEVLVLGGFTGRCGEFCGGWCLEKAHDYRCVIVDLFLVFALSACEHSEAIRTGPKACRFYFCGLLQVRFVGQ
jgi:hypothetical protein